MTPTLRTSVMPTLRPSPPHVAAAWLAWEQGGRRNPLAQWARRAVEKIRTAFGSGRLHFPAWLDNYTEETPEMREEYHRMLKESTLKAALRANTLSVACQEAQTHPQDQDNERERHAAELFRAALDRIGLPSGHGRSFGGLTGTRKLAWGILSGSQINGWSVNECVWNERPERLGKLAGKLTWRDVKAKDSRRLMPIVDQYKNVVGLKLNVDAGRILEGPDLRDLVFYAHWSVYESPLGISEFRAAYRAYWLKNVATQLRALHLDRYTGPFLKGTYSNTDEREALEAALAQARAEGFITLPPTVTVEAMDLAMRGTADFKDAIADCDREMLVGMTGAHLQMMEGESGSPRGDTQVHKEGAELVQWHLAAVMGDVVTSQMAPPWYEVNFPDIPPCSVTWGSVSDEALVASLNLDERLQKLGVPLSLKDRIRFYGRAEPADEADTLKPDEGKGGDDGGLGNSPDGGPPGRGPGGPGGDDNPALPFAEPASDPEEDDPDEQAGLIADLLYHLYGPKALDHLDAALEAKGVKKFAAGWSANDHPRGSGGRFIPRGSPEAVSAAKEVVGRVLKGDHSADADEVTKHLAILTVKQLKQLHQESGVKQIPSYVLRQHLTDAVRDRLASNKEMKSLRDAYKEAKGVRPPDTMTASALTKQIEMAGKGTPVVRGSGTKERAKAAPQPAPTQPVASQVPAAAPVQPEYVADAVRKHGATRGGLAGMLDVRRDLAAAGVKTRAAQDAAIHAAMRAGLVSGYVHDARVPLPPEEREAALERPGGSADTHLVLTPARAAGREPQPPTWDLNPVAPADDLGIVDGPGGPSGSAPAQPSAPKVASAPDVAVVLPASLPSGFRKVEKSSPLETTGKTYEGIMGGRRVTLTHNTATDPPSVYVDFMNHTPGSVPGQVAPNLRAGSLDFARQLSTLAERLHGNGLAISFNADPHHRQVYERILPRLDYTRKTSVLRDDEGEASYDELWVPGKAAPKATPQPAPTQPATTKAIPAPSAERRTPEEAPFAEPTPTKRAEWAAKAAAANVKPAELHAVMRQTRQVHNTAAKGVRDAVAQAYRDFPTHSGGKKLSRADLAKAGDWAGVPGFDTLARSVAGSFPEILGDNGYDSGKGYNSRETEAAEKLYELVMAGKAPYLSADEAYEKSLEHLSRREEERRSEEVPF